MAWDTYYGFPGQFRIEGSEDGEFAHPVLIHEQGSPGLKSPGQNILSYLCPDRPLRFIRMTATRLRNRTGDFTFALGELQAYAGKVNVASGAKVIEADLQDAFLEGDLHKACGLGFPCQNQIGCHEVTMGSQGLFP